ncbi:biogenesis of lysosome-related organelles complex 1 subunit 1-like [Oppia nitens]|uniref:biogenesis of lysosome-related organelles complex 1 subunit 1-like n=1 Tax=Oppia nitens TaxID=1686743 RepID=UPI0023DC81AC|nr:biogenesis of lysosome-related organelles complex 1 subunit 1-like [Oppia nitens]
MLSQMLCDHQIRQNKKRQEIDTKRSEAINSCVDLTANLVNHLNDGVAQTYINQRRLDSESKQLVQNVTQFERSVNQWLHLMNNFNKAVKELGDVQNWAKAIEHDMRTVSSALEYTYKCHK